MLGLRSSWPLDPPISTCLTHAATHTQMGLSGDGQTSGSLQCLAWSCWSLQQPALGLWSMSGTKPKFRPLQYLASKSPTVLKTGWLASPVPGTSATWSLVTHGPPDSGCWHSDKTFIFNQPFTNLSPPSSQVFL